MRVIATLCVMAVLLRFTGLAAGVAPEAIYANTLARMDSLLIGAACAVAVRDVRWKERLLRGTLALDGSAGAVRCPAFGRRHRPRPRILQSRPSGSP